MIVLLAAPDDAHAALVRAELSRPSVTLEVASATRTSVIAAAVTGAESSLRLRIGDDEVDAADVRAIWRRRLGSWNVPDAVTDPVARRFAWSEGSEAIGGFLASAPATWMNRPEVDEEAGRKLVQLQRAAALGMPIPETLVTNDPAAAAEFIDRRGPRGTIRKAFRALADAARPTHRLGPEDLTHLDDIALTPVILQEFIPATLDLRVTIVGDDVFAASIRSEERYASDYRPGLGSATVEACDLPDDVEAKLVALAREFGLEYGAFDLRLTPDGAYVFLEVNPAGEFLFISRRTDQPIAGAVAARLELFDARLGP